MRIAVTGATGFVGAHSVRAMLDAGHQVRILALPDEDLGDALPGVGVDVDRLEVVRGDIRSRAAVTELLDGAQGLLHAAGIVSMDERLAGLMWRVNVEATRQILTMAVDAELDKIVHVCSFSALFPSADPVIGPDTPPAEAQSAYGRSKAEGDRIARRLQAQGAPITITYPTAVVGPAAGSRRGLTADGWGPILKFGIAPSFAGGMGMVDVRDLAELHASIMTDGMGPRRLICGGQHLTFDEMVDALQAAAGRRIRRLRMRPGVIRAMGRGNDLAARLLPVNTTLSHEAALMLTSNPRTDDRAALALLDRPWRPVAQAFADAFADGLAVA